MNLLAQSILALGMPGPFELILLMLVGLLFFGKRLPEVGRSIGQTVVQFKKGMNEMTEEVARPTVEPPKIESQAEATPHKFDPYTGKPIER